MLLDIDRIAPCMPGAALDSVTGDDFTGRVKVKLGPINLTYQGKGSFIEKDETAHKAVIDARGKDQRGNGTAAAIVTATLAAEGSVTRVDVLTDLNITGRPAQFGRGVMTDVGNKLLGQFADKLSAQLASGDAGAVDQATAGAGRRSRPSERRGEGGRDHGRRGRGGRRLRRARPRAGEEGGRSGEEDRGRCGGLGRHRAGARPDGPADPDDLRPQAAASFSGTGTVEDEAPGTEPADHGREEGAEQAADGHHRPAEPARRRWPGQEHPVRRAASAQPGRARADRPARGGRGRGVHPLRRSGRRRGRRAGPAAAGHPPLPQVSGVRTGPASR